MLDGGGATGLRRRGRRDGIRGLRTGVSRRCPGDGSRARAAAVAAGTSPTGPACTWRGPGEPAAGTTAATVAFTAVDTGALTSGVLRGTTRAPTGAGWRPPTYACGSVGAHALLHFSGPLRRATCPLAQALDLSRLGEHE